MFAFKITLLLKLVSFLSLNPYPSILFHIHFIWNNHRHRVSWKTLYIQHKQGGLGSLSALNITKLPVSPPPPATLHISVYTPSRSFFEISNVHPIFPYNICWIPGTLRPICLGPPLQLSLGVWYSVKFSSRLISLAYDSTPTHIGYIIFHQL